MPNLTKVLRLSKSEYFKTHLSIINCLLPKKMTPMEIEVMSIFMSLEGDVAKDRFCAFGKRAAMKALKLSPSGLSNYLGALRTRGFIKEVEGTEVILPLLLPENGEQTYMFKLVNVEHAH